jgi:glycosyltransferase involved in cell wall biosynthesis
MRSDGHDLGVALRILHVVPAYAPAWRYGGPIRSVHELCRSLARHGHDVHVYTTNVDGPDTLDLPTGVPIDRDGVKVWYYPVQFRPLWYSRGMARKLRETVAYFDVVHLHSIFLWPTMAAAREAERRRVPYVAAPRGMLVKDLFAKKRRVIKWLWFYLCEKRTLERASAIHATSDLEVDEARRFKLKRPRFVVIANGVTMEAADLATTAPERCDEVIGPKRYVLFVGRINWKKGLDRLVKSMALVSTDVQLVIAGNDEGGYRADVEAIARECGVVDRVVFTGPVDGSAKAKLFTNASVLALPSYSENFGNVVLEAMACGCPVLVTPEVGLASVVRDTRAGLVADGEPSVLARALSSILGDVESAREMGRRGRETVQSEFGWDAIATKVEELYRTVVAENERPTHAGSVMMATRESST